MLASMAVLAVDPDHTRDRTLQFRSSLARTDPGLRFGAAQWLNPKVGQYEKAELRFELYGTWTNPFDPEEICVDGAVTFPDGSTAVVPAFFERPHRPANGLTQMTAGCRFERDGDDRWCIRMASGQIGVHRLQLSARNRDGLRASGPEMAFRVVPSERDGFVQVSPRNPAYFEYSGSGRMFWPCGSNVAWTRAQDPGTPEPCYEYYFSRASGRANATRVWLCHWAWLEWTPREAPAGSAWEGYGGIGIYNPMIAATLDRVFSLAEMHRLKVMLVTEDNNEHSRADTGDSWQANPYNQLNGGPCAEASEVFTSPEARKWRRKCLRYIIARWGFSDSLWAVNAWNDCFDPTPEVLDWLREMRDHVHGLTTGWRPLVYGSNFRFAANSLMDYAQSGVPLRADRPNVIQECYFTRARPWFRPVLRRQLWEALAGGVGGIMVWPHALVDQTDAWQDFGPVISAAAALPLHDTDWQDISGDVRVTARANAAIRRVTEIRAYGDVSTWGERAPRSSFTIDANASGQLLEGFCPTLYGSARAAWRCPPELVVAMPRDGELLMDLQEIGGGTQVLQATLDGVEALALTFAGGRRTLTESERWARIALPRGRHHVRLDNSRPGSDWVRLRRLLLVQDAAQPGDAVAVTARRTARHGIVYLHNVSSTPVYADALHQSPVLLRDLRIEIPGITPGGHDIQIVSTRLETVVERSRITSDGSRLIVTMPELASGAALIYHHVPE